MELSRSGSRGRALDVGNDLWHSALGVCCEGGGSGGDANFLVGFCEESLDCPCLFGEGSGLLLFYRAAVTIVRCWDGLWAWFRHSGGFSGSFKAD